MLVGSHRQATRHAKLFQSSAIYAKPCRQRFRLFAGRGFARHKHTAQRRRTSTIEMEQCWLTFPQRQEQSTARAQRNCAVISDARDLEADFVLVRDEHQRIAIRSNFENEVAFVVSAG